MAVNKVIYGGETIVDLTNDSVTPETLAKGVTAHDASGQQITGTMAVGEENIIESVSVNNISLPIVNKNVNIDLSGYLNFNESTTISKENLSIDFANSVITSSSSLTLQGLSAHLKGTNASVHCTSDGSVEIRCNNGVVIEGFTDIVGDTNIEGTLSMDGDLVATQDYAETCASSIGTSAINYTDNKFSEAKAYADTVSSANASTALSQAKSYTDKLTSYTTLLSGQYFKTATGTSNIIANIGSSWSSTYNFLLVHVYLNNARYTAVVEKSSNRASVLLQNPWTTSFSLYIASILVNTNGDINFERCGTLSSSSYSEKVNSAGYYISKIVGVKVK